MLNAREWSFVVFATVAEKVNSTTSNNETQQVLKPSFTPINSFENALKDLTKALHDDPVNLGSRTWTTTSSGSATQHNSLAQRISAAAKRPMSVSTLPDPPSSYVTFEGLSSHLINTAFRNRRTVLIGDSTLWYLHQWLQTMVYDMTFSELDSLGNVTMNVANRIVKDRFEKHVQQQWTIRDTIDWIELSNNKNKNNNNAVVKQGEYDNTLTHRNTTIVVWDGYMGPTTTPRSMATSTCQFPMKFWDNTRRIQPNIMIVNFGLHWLHMQGGGRDVPLCYVMWWLHYEDWLEQAWQIAQESSLLSVSSSVSSVSSLAAAAGSTTDTKLVMLYKTNNYICETKFVGIYQKTLLQFEKDRRTLQQELDSNNNSQQLLYDGFHFHDTPMFNACVDQLDRLVQTNGTLEERESLTRRVLYRYCSEGTFDERGVQFLNDRMIQFVRTKQQQQQQQQQQNKNNNNTKIAVAIFNDHDLQSCPYTDITDGRHYKPLILSRIRVLANMIQALS